MKQVTFRLIIALLILAVLITVAAFSWAYCCMPDEPLAALPTPPCVFPPHYESLDLPCSGADFSALPDLPTVVYCELIRNPDLYDRKIIRVRAIYDSDVRHSSWFYDPSCESERNITNVEFGSSIPLFEEGVRMMDQAASRDEHRQGKKVELLVIGRFYGARKEGYGHLNGFPFEFSIMKVEEAKPVDAGHLP